MKAFLFISVFFCFSGIDTLWSQSWDNRRAKSLDLCQDTIRIDTLSIIPGSVIFFDANGVALPDSLLGIDYPRALLICDRLFRENHSYINIRYRVLRHYIPEMIRLKEEGLLQKRQDGENSFYIYSSPKTQGDIFGLGNISSSGSISRGISIGNQQDVVVSSTLNLQLSGQLSDDLYIAAAITDNNIPVQPDGNTQQIQDFEKVFIQIYNNNIKLTAGDFEIDNRNGYFMRFNKKAQGGLLGVNYSRKNAEEHELYRISSTSGAAISKGKYTRNSIIPIEGNQGPYKLKGDNNELFIIILAGTERVFINGRLLSRGQEYDYIINYNTAEITFMPGQLITKDSRIVVEFEYADKNYARAMVYSGNTIENDKLSFSLNFFSEHDMKNQTLFQELSPADESLLSGIGDSLQLALSSGVESMSYDDNYIMYKLVDTTVAGLSYDTVYVFSVNPDSAHYRLRFSFVGAGNGNYNQKQSTLNGRVYEWVAPENGLKQGAYEPVILLIAPQKKQMLTSSFLYNINPNSNVSLELAISNEDINTFSSIDKKDNEGIGLKFLFNTIKPLGKDSLKIWKLKSSLSHEWTQKTFNPIERYRETEFNRNWNISDLKDADEHLSSVKISLYDTKNRHFGYGFNVFFREKNYSAYQNQLNADWHYMGFFIIQNSVLTQTQMPVYNTEYLRNTTTLGKRFRYLTLGFENQFEDNRFINNAADTLMPGGLKFEQYEIFVQSPDTATNKYRLFYKIRNDFMVGENRFKLASKAEESGISLNIDKNPAHHFLFNTAYRRLYHLSNQLIQQGINADNTVLGRVEYNGNIWKGLLSLNSFYEYGTGMEVKKEFSYVEVQAGQGVYTWTDYNNNNLKDLDEFEVAAFQDQANYIRIYMPTNEYIKAFSSSYNQILNILPAAIWRNEKGFKKFASNFSNRTNYQIQKKTTLFGFDAFNPIGTNTNDSALISMNSVFRNNFSVNSNSPVWSIDYQHQSNNSKILMVNGFESRALIKNSIKLRWHFLRKMFFNITAENGIKKSLSAYFPARDFKLELMSIEPVISFQESSRFRNSLSFKNEVKENLSGLFHEKAISYIFSNELRYSHLEKGSFNFKVSYLKLLYNAPDNTPLAYEMLEGLKTGNNITWNVMYQRNLKNNMQLSLIYDGRKPYKDKTIHFGNVQLRAYF
ncbi:MAG: hypothetical protein PHT69_06180 [Bacteroidales bacterium]|nr:hypothetical protein [Bacteroidales bacterium]